MKSRLVALFSLLALLAVSTSVLANGRPTGIRIGRLVSGGALNVELDVTITGTNRFYPNAGEGWQQSTTAWLANTIYTAFSSTFGQQLVSYGGDDFPQAIDWGDGYVVDDVQLFGPPGGPFTGTFAHTYSLPGTYTVTVADAYGPDSQTLEKGGVPFTGNAISSSVRYVGGLATPTFPYTFVTFSYAGPVLVAISANQNVSTGTGIPTLNVFGLLAMAFVLVGTGVLVFRRPHRA